MKSFTTLTISLVIAFSASCQQATDTLVKQPTLTKADYLLKSKHQKTAAWLFLSAGTVGLFTTAISEGSNDAINGFGQLFTLGAYEPEPKSYAVPYVISAALMAASIPLFISASSNKEKARFATAFFKMEKAGVVSKASIKQQSIPSVAIKLSF